MLLNPAGADLKVFEIVKRAYDELETLHRCDGEGKTQEEAGVCMGVTRGTVQRLLTNARCKMAQAPVGQKTLAISGYVPWAGGISPVDNVQAKG
ncbi:MAG: DUF134 domain-containing protein [Desulfuromonadaceae bacterium]|nr:DUF134 domain-containing protein [Desulfuromonadaceae bacterium]MDD2849453.1 DUF134 domain-containing protein [Desulfuromonadaceae bacterium]MDD4130533.1 DUF134 domain-containing protein [Desulfuromonadaceae bacterium]